MNEKEQDHPSLVIQKTLLTTHDPFHTHALLALVCVSHIVYRCVLFARGVHDMGLVAGQWSTLAAIVIHGTLSLSSFVFTLPAKRIKDGSRIWPEFRLQSIIFAWRSLLLMGLLWIQPLVPVAYRATLTYRILAFAGVAFFCMWASDKVSAAYPDTHSNTIRELEAPTWMKRFFSIGQIHGTTIIILATVQTGLFSIQFLNVVLIQATAFAMTLIRKHFITHWTSVVIYFWALLGSIVFTYTSQYWVNPAIAMRTFVLANFFAALRISGGMDKYAVWTLCTIVGLLLR